MRYKGWSTLLRVAIGTFPCGRSGSVSRFWGLMPWKARPQQKDGGGGWRGGVCVAGSRGKGARGDGRQPGGQEGGGGGGGGGGGEGGRGAEWAGSMQKDRGAQMGVLRISLLWAERGVWVRGAVGGRRGGCFSLGLSGEGGGRGNGRAIREAHVAKITITPTSNALGLRNSDTPINIII